MAQLQKITLTLIILLLTTSVRGYAQDKSKTFYRNEKGQTYTTAQFDSIRSVGHPFTLSLIDKIASGDSTILTFEKTPGIKPSPLIGKYEGQPLPEFKLKDIRGNWVSSADLKDKIVYINFWSVSCAPCIVEMPGLNRLKKSYKDNKDVVFLAIADDSDERIRAFMKKHEFDFTIISSTSYFKQLGIDSYPVNFFIDRAGIIRKVNAGTPQVRNEITQEFEISVFQDYGRIINQL